MLRSATSGFKHAPISKGLMWITAGLSLLVSFTNIRHYVSLNNLSPDITQKFQLWRFITHHFFFSSPGEMLFGLILIYYFRLFERQMGSAKFGAFAVLSFALTSLLELSFLVFRPSSPFLSGPYAFIFSNFVLFYFSVPASTRFKFCGINLSDKIFTYLLGFQLLCTHFPLSFIFGIMGIVSGISYRSQTLRLHQYKLPETVNRFCKRFIFPYLKSSDPPRRQPRHTGALDLQAQQLRAGGLQDARAFAYPHGGTTVVPMPSEDNIQLLMSMGFERTSVIRALRTSANNVEVATNILLNS